MAEITVAMLEVDEIVAAIARKARRAHEILDEPGDVVVAQHRPVVRNAVLAVEQGMPVGDHRLEALVVVRLAETAGMGELQADDEAAVVAHGGAVGCDERLAQPGDRALGRLRQDQLVGVGAPVMAHRHRLAAPHELRAALAEALPAPHRVGRGRAIRFSVPALHRVDGEAVADGEALHGQRLRERR